MPGLHVYRSHRIEVLVEVLGALLRAQPPENPFEPVEVVVGSRGMERWLQHSLALRLGVCANIEFPFPLAEVGGLQRAARDERVSDWGREAMVWAILEVLPGLLDRQEFGPLRRYLQGGVERVDARAMGLATRIADLFDRYCTYRPDMVRAWREFDLWMPPRGAGEVAWQPALFREVAARLGGEDPAARLDATIEALQKAPRGRLRRPIRWFGISSVPPRWLPLLGAASRHVDVDLFLLCPSDAWWADVRRAGRGRRWETLPREDVGPALADAGAAPGHALLASMGRVARDFQLLLEQQPEGYEERREDLFPREAPQTRLEWLQRDLLDAQEPSDASERPAIPFDTSIEVHGCYGLTRQVEALRERLLAWLADDASLHPRDILVLCPDISKVAPLVVSVFAQGPRQRRRVGDSVDWSPEGWGPVGAPRLPVQIADLSVRRSHAVAEALLALLDLADGRLEAPDVLALLELDPVQRRFGLDPEDLPDLRDWVRRAGIRWGADGAARQAEGLPADDQNSWQFGLRRLALGVVMADDQGVLHPVEGLPVLPVDDLEGAEARSVGPLLGFYRALRRFLDEVAEPLSLAAWVKVLERALDTFVEVPAEEVWQLRRVREELDAVATAGEQARSARLLDRGALRAALAGRFEVRSEVTREQSGAVTVGSMRPMRSVPYRVVCLLGVDDGELPRQSHATAFDLVALRPAPGDRDPADEDRFLILEAVMAARERLCVFYTSRDPLTNEERPPAIPVAELLESAQGALPKVDIPRVQHPLQAFSERNFGPQPLSFDRRMRAAAQSLQGTRDGLRPFLTSELPAPEARPELSLDELTAFYRAPARALLQGRLGLRLAESGADLERREPVEPDGLETWSLRAALLEARRNGVSVDEVAGRARAEGRLPLGYAGDAWLGSELALVDAMVGEASRVVGARPERAVVVSLEVASRRLTGTVSGWAGPTRAKLVLGRLGAGKLAEAWVQHLASVASSPEAQRTVLVSGRQGEDGPSVTLAGLVTPPEVGPLLSGLFDVRDAVLRGQAVLLPQLSLALAKQAMRFGLSQEDLVATTPRPEVERLARDLHRRWLQPTSDRSDRYTAQLYEGRLPFLVEDGRRGALLAPGFVWAALKVWVPLQACLLNDKAVRAWGEP